MKSALNYTFQGFEIPEYMARGVDRYISDCLQPGDFLTAVITNDLKKAVDRADDNNMKNIPAYIGYFYNETPVSCWGSEKNMTAWMAHGGVNGVIK